MANKIKSLVNEIDLLKELEGKKLIGFKLRWSDDLDDYCLSWLKFEDGSYISLMGEYPKNIVRWFVEDVEP